MLRQRRKIDIGSDYITPQTTQPDVEHDKSYLDYESDNMYDMRNLKYSTLDRLEHGTRITYYVLNHGEMIRMILNENKIKVSLIIYK